VKLALSELGDSDAVEVYERFDSSPLGVMAQSWLAQRHPASADLASTIIEQLEVGPGTDASFGKAVRSVQYIADSFGADQVHSAASLLITQVGLPIDPYAPNPLEEDCRSALVALLIERPEVQDDLGNILKVQSSPTSVPPLVELAAAGIAGRSADLGKSFVRLVQAWQPAISSELAKVAELASSQSALTAKNFVDAQSSGILESLRRQCSLVIAVLIGPLVAVGTGLAAYHWKWAPERVGFGVGEAIAVLAIIATINIFSVQLSADRLPGPLARVAAQPSWLNVSYSSALTLLFITTLSTSSKRLSAAEGWCAVVLALFSIATLVIGLLLIASRTDPARAAAAYVSSSLGTHKRTGRQFGRNQASAAEIRTYVDRLLWVEIALGPQRVGRRTPIPAGRRGILLPTRRGLNRLGRGGQFKSGDIFLRIHEAPGVPFDRGTELAALRPNEKTTIDRSTVERTKRVLRVVGVRRLDRTVAAGSALVSLALELGLKGDTGSAHLVADSAVLLVVGHVGATRQTRRERFDQIAGDEPDERNVLRPDIDSTIRRARQRDGELAPVSPVLNVAVRLTMNNRLHHGQEVGDLPEYILRPILDATTLADGGCALASGLLPRSWEELSASAEQVGRLAELIAIRSMELGDRNSLVMVRTALDALAKEEPNRIALLDSGSIIAANSCWIFPIEGPRFADWYIDLVGRRIRTPRMVLFLLRIGGAALATGRLQVATTIASQLGSEIDLSDSRISMSTEAVRTRETLLSDVGGRYLGDSPADTIDNFVQFVSDMRAPLTNAAAGN
jgi:hypothetical protein